jgi:hypothetical protein
MPSVQIFKESEYFLGEMVPNDNLTLWMGVWDCFASLSITV